MIMPVYNGGKYLSEAIDSVLQQSFADFEFLICDDCSTDGSAEILARAAGADKRIRLFCNEKNSGVALTLNRLLKEVRSPLVARMDCDDICSPDRLEKQFAFLTEHPEIAVAGCQLEIIGEAGERLGHRSYPVDMKSIRHLLMCRNPLAHPAVMMRLSAVEAVQGYQDITGCEDYDLWLRLAAQGSVFANLPETLLHYRMNSQQIKQRDMKKSLRGTIAVQSRFLFRKGFFSLRALSFFAAEFMLLLLPNKLLLKLFARVTYK